MFGPTKEEQQKAIAEIVNQVVAARIEDARKQIMRAVDDQLAAAKRQVAEEFNRALDIHREEAIRISLTSNSQPAITVGLEELVSLVSARIAAPAATVDQESVRSIVRQELAERPAPDRLALPAALDEKSRRELVDRVYANLEGAATVDALSDKLKDAILETMDMEDLTSALVDKIWDGLDIDDLTTQLAAALVRRLELRPDAMDESDDDEEYPEGATNLEDVANDQGQAR